MLSDDVVRKAGQEGVMHDVPMLFGIGDSVTCGKETVEIMGHARFSYGRGFWDEFWGITGKGAPRWVSVDEGDIVLQAPLDPADYPSNKRRFYVGQHLTTKRTDFDVVEIDSAECVALLGSFDEEMFVGETYRFVNAQNSKGVLLSGEIWTEGEAWFIGDWYDPFEVKVTKGPGA